MGAEDLEECAGLDHWRGFYRMASHGTHANPKGIIWNVQSYETVDLIWAGPSNAGLVDPAQCSLIALANVNARLLAYMVGELPDSDDFLPDVYDSVVQQKVILIPQSFAIETLGEVHAQQVAEEESAANLVGQAAAILRGGAPMTADDLSTPKTSKQLSTPQSHAANWSRRSATASRTAVPRPGNDPGGPAGQPAAAAGGCLWRLSLSSPSAHGRRGRRTPRRRRRKLRRGHTK